MKWRKARPLAEERRANPTALWPKPSPARVASLAYEEDEAFHALYERAMETTATGGDSAGRRLRLYAVHRAVIATRDVPGAVAEAGCFRGLSSYVIAATIVAGGRPRPFHICDSFEGLSELAADDAARPGIATAKARAGALAAEEATVRANLAEFDFVSYHRGWIPAPFAALADTTFSYVHVDVDLVAPTRAACEFFWPRLSVGGAIGCDDYGSLRFPGARKAVDVFFADRTDAFFLPMPSGHALAVKLPAASLAGA